MRFLMMPLLAAALSVGLSSAPVHAAPASGKAVAGKPAKAGGKAKAVSATKSKTAKKPAARKTGKATSRRSAVKGKALKAGKLKGRGAKAKTGKQTVVSAAPEIVVAAAADTEHLSERVYEGTLPTPEEKVVLPAALDPSGRAECVQLLKSLMDAPRTLFWKEGRKLKASWDKLQPGTAIATFKKGRYPQQGRGPGSKHAAIFLRASQAGIYVLDQFAGKLMAEERFIPWHHPRDKRPSNNATAYSTVRW